MAAGDHHHSRGDAGCAGFRVARRRGDAWAAGRLGAIFGRIVAGCLCQLHSPNGRVHRDLLQLVPAKAIRRREDDAGIATVVPSPTEARRVRLIRSSTRGEVVGHRHYGCGCERPLRPTIEAWRSLEGERFDTKGAVAVLNRVRGQRVRDAWEARPHPPRTTRARPGWAIAGAVAVFLIAYGPQAVSVFMLYLSPAASADRASASTTMIHDAIGGQLAQLYVNSVRNNSAELLTRRPWS